MGSLIEELQRREAAARQEVDERADGRPGLRLRRGPGPPPTARCDRRAWRAQRPARGAARPVRGSEVAAGSVARDAKDVIRAAFGQAEARDPAHLRTWAVLVDGDRHQIELIQAEAARVSSVTQWPLTP